MIIQIYTALCKKNCNENKYKTYIIIIVISELTFQRGL